MNKLVKRTGTTYKSTKVVYAKYTTPLTQALTPKTLFKTSIALERLKTSHKTWGDLTERPCFHFN